MEFTFNGIVRESFGFYNPNHAAAFIAMLLPFVWYGFIRFKFLALKIILGLINLTLVTALAMTFSRSGIVIAIIEFILFFLFFKEFSKKQWKILAVFSFVSLAIIISFGVLSRFKIDNSTTNRFDIWIAGAKLFASNPLTGVGFGNSGEIASTFLLPNNITCRTLVNSHLTILTEFGMFLGGIWALIILYALIIGYKKKNSYIAFVGLTIAACLSTIFDFEILLDFKYFGDLGISNFLMSYILLASYLALVIYLIMQKIDYKKLLISFGVCCILIACMFLFYNNNTPRINGNLICFGDYKQNLIIHDSDYPIKNVSYFANEQKINNDYAINIKPIPTKNNYFNNDYKNIFLLGNATEFINLFTDNKIFLVNPSDFLIDSLDNSKVDYEIINF